MTALCQEGFLYAINKILDDKNGQAVLQTHKICSQRFKIVKS